MKHKIGDKVKIKSLDWYNTEKDLDIRYNFTSEMAKYCGKESIITQVYRNAYCIEIDNEEHYWEDSVFEDTLPISYKMPVVIDNVNHPSHYTWLKDLCGIEVIDITRHMDFDLGNATKYILRSGHKFEQGLSNKKKAIEDLRKAIWYINDKIKMLESNEGSSI